jgi:tRNA pseudouridine55 synthase
MSASHYHGLLVVDKPGGMTSRDAVNLAQKWFPRGTKIGHTGTLDPLATGVLVLCVGAATRLTEYVQRMDKEYRTTIALDKKSTTDDQDGVIERPEFPPPHPDRGAVERCVQEFVGEIEQVPPAYSAAKISGQRAYDLARRGDEVSLAPRRVQIYEIEILGYSWPTLELRVCCGKGTYIRSLARDIGQRLDRAGMVESLRRTRVGPFREAESLRADSDAAIARSRLLPLFAAVSDLPKLTLDREAVTRLRQGQAIPAPAAWSNAAEQTELAVFDLDGKLVAIARSHRGTQMLSPKKVLP